MSHDSHDEDAALKLVEWIEIQRALGVNKIVAYITGREQHPNVVRVMRHYKNIGYLTLRDSAWPGRYSWPTALIRLGFPAAHAQEVLWARHVILEMLNVFHCLLESMDKFHHIAVLDLDELILPTSPTMRTWIDMKRELPQIMNLSDPTTSVCFREKQMAESDEVFTQLQGMPAKFVQARVNVSLDHLNSSIHYFLTRVHTPVKDEDKKDMTSHWPRHKCIHNANRILAAFSHTPSGCIFWNATQQAPISGGRDYTDGCGMHLAPIALGRSFHYRAVCDQGDETPDAQLKVTSFPCRDKAGMDSVALENADFTIFKYRDVLEEEVRRVALQLGIL